MMKFLSRRLTCLRVLFQHANACFPECNQVMRQILAINLSDWMEMTPEETFFELLSLLPNRSLSFFHHRSQSFRIRWQDKSLTFQLSFALDEFFIGEYQLAVISNKPLESLPTSTQLLLSYFDSQHVVAA